mgnify:CR=1 FL=1
MHLDPMSMDLDAARLAVVELKRTLALRDDEIEQLKRDVFDRECKIDSWALEVQETQHKLAVAEKERDTWRDTARAKAAWFCTHCGATFPKGVTGKTLFNLHIAECNVHPLNPIALERDTLREQLAAVRAELDLVANSIGTLKLCDDINIANRDAMTAIIVHIDRFLKRAKEAVEDE